MCDGRLKALVSSRAVSKAVVLQVWRGCRAGERREYIPARGADGAGRHSQAGTKTGSPLVRARRPHAASHPPRRASGPSHGS